ncbi:hypothetical protein [Leptospira weilii]|uniref:Uncharacterized protein n=1 Tax=Leptospira weilii str. UI 13098 TaxID=1088542 RepID=M6QP37_9LEPT|nr:hypothetical protein [Leptospira weilii]EMN90627.1 hypothetical protein LEP1GSC108_3372 [Leptospira weilii str. UI 13098]
MSKTSVYNLEIEENHSYYVGKGGVLVHNYGVEESNGVVRVKPFESQSSIEKVLDIFSGLGNHAQSVDIPILFSDKDSVDRLSISIYADKFGGEIASDGSLLVTNTDKATVQRRMSAIQENLTRVANACRYRTCSSISLEIGEVVNLSNVDRQKISEGVGQLFSGTPGKVNGKDGDIIYGVILDKNTNVFIPYINKP